MHSIHLEASVETTLAHWPTDATDSKWPKTAGNTGAAPSPAAVDQMRLKHHLKQQLLLFPSIK